MCSTPSAPPPPPPPVEPPAVAKEADEAVQRARSDERNRARASAGSASTVLTSPLGVTGAANTSTKRLTGQ